MAGKKSTVGKDIKALSDEEKREMWARTNAMAQADYAREQEQRRRESYNKLGVPSMRTQAIVDEIIERLEMGETLVQICKSAHLPHQVTFYKWMKEDVKLDNEYTRARNAGADAFASQIIDISDEQPNYTFDEEGNRKVDNGFVAWQRLRADSRKWIASKYMPRTYADRQVLTGTDRDGSPITLDVKESSDSMEKMMAIIENMELKVRASKPSKK